MGTTVYQSIREHRSWCTW